jgi:shikimate dehydrogenase
VRLSPSTRVAAVVGHPITHSLSPAIHNAAFAACELDWVYLAFDVAPGEGAAAVRAMRTLGLAGLSVTMPHKEDAAGAVDRLSGEAAALGAINTVVVEDGEVVGENTDGAGFLDALRLDHGLDVSGRRAVVLGAGGAARAVVLALVEAGVESVAIANRTAGRAERAAALGGGRATVVPPDGVAEVVAGADLLVNATPVGMAEMTGADSGIPVDPSALHPGLVVVDLVYRPEETPLLRAATERGARAVGGLGMLVHQAAHQFRRWTGLEPPIDVMDEAARDALATGGT